MDAVTWNNFNAFVGKKVDRIRRAGHYYPLQFCEIKGERYYIDNNDVMIPFHKDDKIWFDTIIVE